MSKQTPDPTGEYITPAPGGRYHHSQQSAEIKDIDPLAKHEAVNHFALVYEDRSEQFATMIPFIRDGLERDERCVYVANDNSVDEVLDAMRARGIDVDDALESGMLSVHTEEETYCRTGEFDREAMMDFWKETLSDATDDGFTGLRAAAEMTWVLEADDTDFDHLCEYEELLNPLYDGEDYTVLCQYNRDRFPEETLHDVLKTHPYLIHDAAVCENVYYTPPEEYFGPDRPSNEFDRKLATLVDRTEVQNTLQTQTRLQHQLYEIVSQPGPFDKKLQAIFDLGCDRFDLDLGGVAKVDPESGLFEVEAVSGEHDHLVPGARVDLGETYCRTVADEGAGEGVPDPVAITDPEASGFSDEACVVEFGVQTYLGTRIPVTGDDDRTFFFVAEDPRDDAFTQAERTFHRLMGQWIRYELERRERERFLRNCYQLTANPDSSFEEKLDALIDLGREQFGFEYGGLAKIDPATDYFEVETINGDHDHLTPGNEYRLSETYCQLAANDGETAAVSDPISAGFEKKLCYQRFGVQAYLGTHLPVDGEVDRTFWFISNEPRDTPITDEEQTFIHLMGQWIQYELERRQHEQELRQTRDRFETVFEQSDDAIYLLDPDADEIVDANPAACEKTGYTYDELMARGISDLHPDEMEQVRAFLSEARAKGSAWTEDLHCRHKDGYDILVEVVASPITLDGRKLILANVRDIEQRKTHEQYQRDLHEITSSVDLTFDEKLERLLELGCDRFGFKMGGLNHLPEWDGKFRLEKGVGLDLAPDEELWTNPDNDCYCRQTITEDEPVDMADVRGTSWTEDVIYQEFGLTSYLGIKVSSGTTPYGTLWFGSAEPREKPFTAAERSFIELMGQWVGYEIERREYNKSQRDLYRIAADTDLSTDEKIDRLLEVGCDRLDLPVGMLTHERTEAFEIEHMHGTHPDLDEGALTPPLTDNYCRRVVDTGDSISVGDAGAAGWDGDALYHEFDLQCYAGTQVTVDGDTYGTVCFSDTAPREEFTEAEQAFVDLLGQCIGYEFERQQYEQELEVTIDRLQLSNERLEQFAYAASHDMQEPLRMVTSYLQLIERRYGDAFDEEGEEFLEFAVDGAERMRDMIEALLEYSRVERQGNQLESIELETVLDDVLTDLQVEIDETNAEITVEQLPRVEGDSNQLRQVFQNLLDNAITYSGDQPPQIHIDAEQEGQEWMISVHDNGMGIDPEDQDKIFSVFDRLHSRDEYDGTGIGLALCQRIVERHNGEIWVESEPGEGSTFTVTLPISQDR